LAFKPDVSPDGSPMRLRQHGTFFFFTKNSRCEFFGEKDRGFFALPEALSPSTPEQ
jgi:hypothetical protein